MNELLITLCGLIYRLLGDGSYQLVPRIQRWKDIQGGWAESSGQAVNIIIWVLGVLVAGVVTFTIINQRREAIKRRERETVYFRRKAVDKELDEKQMKLIVEAIQATGFSQPYRLLDSFDIFQGFFHSYEEKQNFSEQEHQYFREMLEELKEKLGYHKIEEAVPIEASTEIRVGQPVKIQLIKDGQDYEYPSSVIENDNRLIMLDGSHLDKDFLKPNESTKVDVRFYREGDAGYQFKTTFLDPAKLEKGKVVLKHPARLNRIQARNFSRMDVNFPFNFYHVLYTSFNTVEIDYNLRACESLPVYMGETVDISGGGLALNTSKKVSRGDFLYLNFQMLGEHLNEPILAEVVWYGKDKGRNTLLLRAKFYDITDKVRDELMRFVSQMQRKVARRLKFAPKR